MTRQLPSGDITAVEHYFAIHDPNATPEEIERAVDWLESDCANEARLVAVDRFMARCREVRALVPPTELAHELKSSRRPFFGRVPAWAWAACLALAIALPVSLTVWHQTAQQSAARITRHETAIGETRVVNLADGSRVTLAGASAISVAYSRQDRHITLTDGEALFDVAKDPGRPFIVQTFNGSTRAVGTRFDVRRSLIGTTVTVVHGKVEVTALSRDQTTIVPLAADRQVTYNSAGEVTNVVKVDASQATSWQHGVLQFQDTPLSLVVQQFNRYSSKEIVLNSAALGEKRITGIARIDDIASWLQGLASDGRITMRVSGQRIILDEKPAPPIG